ncbi:MAG: hypothetical protein JOZ43_09455 [Acidobacteriales bacterium]|nr:hypothetical protein [Terriglobales bacterium]
MNKLTVLVCLGMLWSCGPPKPTTPSLNPEQAAALLQFDNKAQNWIKYVKKNNAACEYRLDLPDQSSHPTTIDIDHIVLCGNRPSPKEFDASVSFVYDTAQGKWVISRFSS